MTYVSGRLVRTSRGNDLKLFRSLALPIEETWEYLTDRDLTDKWFGPWEGDARPGGAVSVHMRFEAGEPLMRMRIDACEAPHRLALTSDNESGNWRLELQLTADGLDTTLAFIHHLNGDESIGEIGPGWEYYLDLLVAATDGAEEPMLDQYFPVLQEEYEALTAE